MSGIVGPAAMLPPTQGVRPQVRWKQDVTGGDVLQHVALGELPPRKDPGELPFAAVRSFEYTDYHCDPQTPMRTMRQFRPEKKPYDYVAETNNFREGQSMASQNRRNNHFSKGMYNGLHEMPYDRVQSDKYFRGGTNFRPGQMDNQMVSRGVRQSSSAYEAAARNKAVNHGLYNQIAHSQTPLETKKPWQPKVEAKTISEADAYRGAPRLGEHKPLCALHERAVNSKVLNKCSVDLSLPSRKNAPLGMSNQCLAPSRHQPLTSNPQVNYNKRDSVSLMGGTPPNHVERPPRPLRWGDYDSRFRNL